MLPYFWYLLKVIICSGILFGYYWLFLRNKLFHQYNRFYLLSAMGLSLLLPLLKIDFWQQGSGNNQAIRMLQAVSAGDEYVSNAIITADKVNWNFEQLYLLVYWVVSLVFFMILLRTIFVILKLMKQYPVQRVDDISFVNTTDESTPFSFLKYIFWNDNIDITTVTGRQIFKHEVAHIQEKHTYDKLFTNILLIFCWCNPFFWLYRKELNMIHEFIADKRAVEDSDTASFAAMILQATYPKQRFELTNNFFYSPIKRRLLMLTKIDNPRVSYFVRVMVLPLVVFVFAAFTFKAKKDEFVYHGKKITVVIDAGHGGKDAGAGSADGIFEKDLALALAKKIKELNKNEAIDILLTREEDIYQSPQQKAAVAGNNNADLLISLHIGSTARPDTKTGIEFFVAGDQFTNAEKSKGLASSLIRAFEKNFPLPVSGSPLQRDMGIWILQANNIPSVLIEAGYITNEKDLAYLKTPAAKETIAKNVLAAIEEFASSGYISPVSVSEMKLQKITDTLPAGDKADIEKALVIINGKVAGKGKKVLDQQSSLISAKTVNVKWLGKKAATEKYGQQGTDGACEINFAEDAALTNANDAGTAKMNILYIGVENELSVAPKDALVTISDGEIIAKGSGKYIARVTHPGVVIITVSGNQATSKFMFAVRILPEPSDPNFPAEFRKHLTVNGEYFSGLGQKNILDKDARLSPADSLAYKTILENKLRGLELEKAKLDMVKEQQATLKQQYEEKLAQAKVQDANLEKMIEERKIREQEFTKLKEKLQYLEEKNKSDLAEATVEGRKLNDQEIAALKQKLVSEQKANSMQQNEVKLKLATEKNNELEKELYRQKLLLARQDDKVFTKMEVVPRFTGGQDAWRKYLRENLKSAVPVDEGWKAGKYTVIVKFIVHTDGTVSNVTTENYKGSKTAAECIRVIKNTPKWQPAMQNEVKVNAYHKQPITFVIEE